VKSTAPLWVIAVNLAAFLASSSCFLSDKSVLSHHWIFPLHAGLIFAQGFLLRGRYMPATIACISFLLLGISLARLETIYLSHHLVHFSLAWAFAFGLHLRLGIRSGAGAFRNLNLLWAGLCGISAIASFFVAFRQGIWWGIGPDP
jgi:hypothetical protein